MPFSKKELGESGYQLYQSMFESMESRGRNPPNIAVFTPTTTLQLLGFVSAATTSLAALFIQGGATPTLLVYLLRTGLL
jgi:hypothetical protein